MDSPCLALNRYWNLLRPCTKIETAFMRELQAQQQVLASLRLFGTSATCTLTSMIGEIHRLTRKEEKEK